MNTMRAGTKAFGAWPKKDIQAHIAFMRGFSKELRESGELVAAEGLDWPDQAKLVRAAKDGAPITDGVFQAHRSPTVCSRRPRSFWQAIGSLKLRARSGLMRPRPGRRRRRDPVEPR